MPSSRKRAKGKARKAGKESNKNGVDVESRRLTESQKEMCNLINGLSLAEQESRSALLQSKNLNEYLTILSSESYHGDVICNHGCTLPPMGSLIEFYVYHYATLLDKRFDEHEEWRGDGLPFEAAKCLYAHQEAREDVNKHYNQRGERLERSQWSAMAECLVHLGTEYLLRGDRDPRYKEMATSVAWAVSSFEPGDPKSDPVKMRTERSLIEGNERDIVRFFSKRINCDCLKQKRKDTKSETVLSWCNHCKKRRIRKQLMVCTGCNYSLYCSQKCQSADWPFHKKFCRK